MGVAGLGGRGVAGWRAVLAPRGAAAPGRDDAAAGRAVPGAADVAPPIRPGPVGVGPARRADR